MGGQALGLRGLDPQVGVAWLLFDEDIPQLHPDCLPLPVRYALPGSSETKSGEGLQGLLDKGRGAGQHIARINVKWIINRSDIGNRSH